MVSRHTQDARWVALALAASALAGACAPESSATADPAASSASPGASPSAPVRAHVRFLASEGVATPTRSADASASPQRQRPDAARHRDPADQVRNRVLRLVESLNAPGSPNRSPRQSDPRLTDLDLGWDHCTAHLGEALGHRWALFVADAADGWREPQPAPASPDATTAAPRRWCCLVWPVRGAPRARAWFANHEGAVWESAVPPAIDLATWRPDPSVIAPTARAATSYLRRPSGAGFVWSAINVLPSAPR